MVDKVVVRVAEGLVEEREGRLVEEDGGNEANGYERSGWEGSVMALRSGRRRRVVARGKGKRKAVVGVVVVRISVGWVKLTTVLLVLRERRCWVVTCSVV